MVMCHRLFMTGSGEFSLEDVKGGGSFDHRDGNSGVPQTILGTGMWEVKRVIGFTKIDDPNNPFGQIIAGILDLEIRLFLDGGPKKGVLANLKIVCNVGPAGIFTGLPEGIFLEIPDAGLSFEPIITPDGSPLGLTAFTLVDGDDERPGNGHGDDNHDHDGPPGHDEDDDD